MTKLQVGDVVLYTRFQNRNLSKPFYALAYTTDRHGVRCRPLTEEFKFGSWELSYDAVECDEPEVARTLVPPEDWPDEVAVAVAKWRLGNE